MPDPSAINLLRQVIHHARRGQPIPPEAAGWLVAGAQRYEASARAGEAIGLDVALGLGVPGRHGWWTVEARARRDDLLRELRGKRFAHLDDAEAARQIHAMVRLAPQEPALSAALSTGLGMPGVKQLKTILGRKSAALGFIHRASSTTLP